MSNTTDRHVIFRLAQGYYAIDAAQVVEMQGMGKLDPHPHGTSLVRGVATLRGRLVPVVDVRARMGLPRAEECARALSASVDERAQQHQQLFDQAAAAVESGHGFRCASCDLDDWLGDNFASSAEMSTITERLTAAHEAVHNALLEASRLAACDDFAAAGRKLSKARDNELETLRGLLERLRAHARSSVREIVLYVDVGGAWRGLVVDAVVTVTSLEPHRHADEPENATFVDGMVAMPGTGRGVYVLDLERLLRGDAKAA